MSTGTQTDAGEGVHGWVVQTGRRVRARADALTRRRLLDGIDERYRPLTAAVWTLALVFYVVGDTGLTTVVLELGGFEVNPVAQAFLEQLGYLGLVVQKLSIVGVLALIWRYYPTVPGLSRDPWRLVVPGLAAGRGAQLVAIHVENIVVML